MSPRFLATHVMFAVLAGLPTSTQAAGDEPNRLARLRELISTLPMEIPSGLYPKTPRFCEQLLTSIQASTELVPIQPTVEADGFADERLSSYKEKCSRLDISEWNAPPPPGVLYHAMSDFRVFELPRDFGTLKRAHHFIFYAESYFSPEEKERFKNRPDIYPWAGYAYADGAGGGGLYSVIDTESCEVTLQLVVHGRFSQRHQRATSHFNQLFIYRNALFAYEFHNYNGEGKDYASVVVWKFAGDDKVRQACVFSSADSREHAKDAIRKNMASQKRGGAA